MLLGGNSPIRESAAFISVQVTHGDPVLHQINRLSMLSNIDDNSTATQGNTAGYSFQRGSQRTFGFQVQSSHKINLIKLGP